MTRPSDDLLRLYGITPQERQRNVDHQERQFSALIDAAEAVALQADAELALSASPAPAPATTEPDDI